MAQDPPRLISTPLSATSGFKYADGRTWKLLLISAAIAVVFVVAFNLLVEKKPIKWPATHVQAPAAQSEPRTYNVAPPGSLPQRPVP
jgi:hypothetical protein